MKFKDSFFDRIDWAAFWTATLATAAVYFYTLGPSVGLEGRRFSLRFRLRRGDRSLDRRLSQ